MLNTFVESVPMKELFERTVRHAPTGRFEAALLVRPSGSHTMVFQRATEYLVRNLVRRMAVEAGAELRVSMLSAEARVRQAFNMPRLKPYLRDWCDHVNAARAVFKEFTEGGEVSRSRLVTACQSMALLETLLNSDIARFDRLDPARTDAAVGRELLAIWEALDARDLLAPSAVAVLHPQLARAGTLKTSGATLLVDGTLIDVTTRADAKVNREDLRLLAGKAAQARLGGAAEGRRARDGRGGEGRSPLRPAEPPARVRHRGAVRSRRLGAVPGRLHRTRGDHAGAGDGAGRHGHDRVSGPRAE
jgi:hypothetical protein